MSKTSKKEEQIAEEDPRQTDGMTSATPSSRWPRRRKKKDDKEKPKGFMPWRYTKELFNDTRFWKQLTLTKGGLGVVATGALLLPTILTLPLILAASAIAVGGVLAVAATFSVIYGLKGLANTFSKTRKKINGEFTDNKKDLTAKKDEMALSQTRFAFKDMLKDKWPIRPIINSKLVKKANNSRMFNRFKSFMNESDNLLDTLTVKNSALSIAIFGSMLLTVEIVAAPVFLTVAVLAYTVASVGFGLYMGYEGVRDIMKRKKEKRKAKQLELARANTPKAKLVKNIQQKTNTAKKRLLRLQFWKAADKDTAENKEEQAAANDATAANENTAAPAAQKKWFGKKR